ncbi:conserved phage C-terminal domain-containing protein [Serratia marcescens]|uniref:helix-turn-helix domain-containing protein n=1 Tax=Serratia marcescens TaxID=615 RepID=UPI0018D802DC|nr:conserved phage C-terminal domain-containing protein [Serratia marcescens]MBH2910594.1 conserved phage C-terminal domain-containing protein [Serratia marcescens]
MSIDAMNWAKKIKTGKSSAKSVLTWLADMCGPDHCAFPSIGALAEATELDKKTVQSSLQYLIAIGLIEDTGERRGRTNQIPVYRLVGIEESVADAEHTQKREHYQKRDRSKKAGNDPKKGIVCNDPENGNVTENGIVQGKAPENGVVNASETIPFLEGNDPENGIRNLSGILKPKEIPPIAPQTEQPVENFADLAGEVLDFLNSKINGRTPKRADTLREITERLAEGNSVDELNLVAEHRASQLLNNPELGHMLSARMIFDPTRFGGYLAAAKAWDVKRVKKSAMVAAVEQQRQEPPAGDVPEIDFDDSFARLFVEGLPPENPAEKSAWQHVQKYGFSANDEDGARREWRVILTRAYAKTRGGKA